MGFPIKMVDVIMRCIKTVSFSILINGHPTETFFLQRGLRQGDPLSPYLYILCAEVLSGLLTKAQQEGHIQGISIATNASAISHLLYADDSILFCRAKTSEAKANMDILTINIKTLQDKKSTWINLR